MTETPSTLSERAPKELTHVTAWWCPVHGQRPHPMGSVGQCGAGVRVRGVRQLVFCDEILQEVPLVPKVERDHLLDVLRRIAQVENTRRRTDDGSQVVVLDAATRMRQIACDELRRAEYRCP
jgi:hypothetical protein